jgi:hypothetical protein
MRRTRCRSCAQSLPVITLNLVAVDGSFYSNKGLGLAAMPPKVVGGEA